MRLNRDNRGVLPVSTLSLEEIGDKPDDGEKYLALVRAEANSLPLTVTNDEKEDRAVENRKVPIHPLRKQFSLAMQFEDAEKNVLKKTRPYLLSSEAWRSEFFKPWFGRLQSKMRNVINSEKLSLPPQADIDAWRKRLYPNMTAIRNHVEWTEVAEQDLIMETEEVVELNVVEHVFEEDVDFENVQENAMYQSLHTPVESMSNDTSETDSTLSPTIQLISSMSSPLCFTLLQHHLKWLPLTNSDIPTSLATLDSPSNQAHELLLVQLRWIFHLLLRLSPDSTLVLPEQHAMLRDLTRRCRWIRSKIHKDSSDNLTLEMLPSHQQAMVAALNMIISTTTLFFGQFDLSDPIAKEHGEVE